MHRNLSDHADIAEVSIWIADVGELPENASRGPASWRTERNTETANVAHDGQTGPNGELLLSHVDDYLQSFPHDQSLLLHPSV
jgi:hypothetical protein